MRSPVKVPSATSDLFELTDVFRSHVRRLLCWVMLLFALSTVPLPAQPLPQAGAISPERVAVPADVWLAPRSVARLLNVGSIRDVLQRWTTSAHAEIIVHYPGGEEGQLQAYELRDWLVGMGVASDHVRLLPGVTQNQLIELQLVGLPG